jgi:demethylmenaquinone methyltransferase/2-methoxy-6-polyprenyl-1,4-benzoquinol methylase
MHPDQETLADMFRQAGMVKVSYENLTAGVVAIHKGWKLA